MSHGLSDQIFRVLSFASAGLVLLVLAGILGSMVVGGWPAFREFGFLGFITSSTWNVGAERFGAWPAIAGTLSSSFIALVIGVPVS
ncbi:MAG: phosphate ABC transporter permease subunit PstC, partial [Methylobacteriaceae bacterium]|nr:phosphate ABC transporter permease subunit PstC [Methylobacteriaceae bacterium]